MPYIFPILREAINLPIYCQYLESQEPILSNPQRDAPVGEQFFELSGAKMENPEILDVKKSCAARPRATVSDAKKHIFTLKNAQK